MPTRTLRSLPFAFVTLLLSPGMTAVAAQGGGGAAPPAAPMINQSSDPLLKSFRFRNIGPASMGGRIHDIEVSESNPSIIYLGYAVGGIWKSVNNGTTFEPVFDTYEVASFGDLAIHPTNPDIVYAGSGESNNRQSSSFGGGMYKTTDGGKSWQLLGLRETQSIARVVIDPKNPETVYAAVFGAAVRPERGSRDVQDHEWRPHLEQDQVHRREHRIHRHRDRSVESERAVCGQLPAAADALLLQWRRPGQRNLEVDEWREHVDEDDRQRIAVRHVRAHRARCIAFEPGRRVCADRGGPGRPGGR